MVHPDISIQTVLEGKGRAVVSLPPDEMVYRAVELMAEKSIGAVLVMDGDQLLGIVSERDYARKVVLKGKSSKETRIREIMTSPVIYVTADWTVDQAMTIMTERRIRHLPVLEGERVVGIVSVGDMVKAIVSAQAETINHLHAYIGGQYPG